MTIKYYKNESINIEKRNRDQKNAGIFRKIPAFRRDS